MMKVNCEKSEEKVLSEDMSNFWRLDLLGIAEDEISENEGTSNIKFENGRYKVDLPFKSGHPKLPDNYTLCKRRLEVLKDRLDKDTELKVQYDQIIKDQLECGVI